MINNLMYIELKMGYSDDDPAWIGYVKTSKSRIKILLRYQRQPLGFCRPGGYFYPGHSVKYTRPCNNCLPEHLRIPSWLFPVSHGIFF